MKHESDKGSSCSESSRGLPISLKVKAKARPKPWIPRLHDMLLVSPILVLTPPALLTEAYFLFLKHASTLLPQNLCIGLPCLERSLVAHSFFSLTPAPMPVLTPALPSIFTPISMSYFAIASQPHSSISLLLALLGVS